MSEPSFDQNLFCPLCHVNVPHFILHLREKHSSSLSIFQTPQETTKKKEEEKNNQDSSSSSSVSAEITKKDSSNEEKVDTEKSEGLSGDQTRKVADTQNPLGRSAGARSDDEVKDVLRSSLGRHNELINSLRGSLNLNESWGTSDNESYFGLSETEEMIDVYESLFDVTDDTEILIPHNIDINALKMSIDQEISFLPPLHEIKALDVLSDTQRRALKIMTEKCKSLSEEAYPRVLEKCKALSISEDDLKRTLRYIRDEAPLIIHVYLNNLLDAFLNDTHYRNQFETNTSNGYLSNETRVTWEDRMFYGAYNKATSFERVKYGVLNVVNDPNGIESCTSYGDSFFILKNVRLRTTFADRDSGYDEALIATCEYYCHVLEFYTDEDLQMVVRVAKNFSSDPTYSEASSGMGEYKEIQIHGPLTFKDCIKAIRLAPYSFPDDSPALDKLREFCLKNNIFDVKYTDGRVFDVGPPPSSSIAPPL